MSYSRGSTPARDYGYDDHYTSSSPTPSPHRYHDFPEYAYPQQRPATRAAHSRHKSTSYAQQTPLPARPPTAHGYAAVAEGMSPRYTSGGVYATANVSESRSSRKYSWSTPRPPRHHERRSSQTYYRVVSDRESDEDEFFEIDGVAYVLPAQSSRPRRDSRAGGGHHTRGGHGTDYHYYYEQVNTGLPPMSPMQAPMGGFPSPAATPQPSRRPSHSRRPSTSVPQRSQTVRPSSSQHKKAAAQPQPKQPEHRPANEKDAIKHRIPEGYSLTHWDPTEQPILLLGSVFDANSLGKWIYDWTVYHHGKGHPIAQIAGDLWLLLIQISGKVKRADEVLPSIRQVEVREMVADFIESGDRLTDKLRKLLKRCEAPMLQASSSKRKGSRLGSNAGVEFVLTLFGRERELASTEKFMASVRLWNLRFDANCEEVLLNPGK